MISRIRRDILYCLIYQTRLTLRPEPYRREKREWPLTKSSHTRRGHTYPELSTALSSFSSLRREVRLISHSSTLSTARVSSPTTSCSTWSSLMWDGIFRAPLKLHDTDCKETAQQGEQLCLSSNIISCPIGLWSNALNKGRQSQLLYKALCYS